MRVSLIPFMSASLADEFLWFKFVATLRTDYHDFNPLFLLYLT